MRFTRFTLLSLAMVFTVSTISAQASDLTSEVAREPESPLRRGEVVFFISYPFTFLGSFVAYNLAGYAATALDGKTGFSASGGGFYALVAATAAIMSFGIAMNDFYSVKAQARVIDGNSEGYLALTRRF